MRKTVRYAVTQGLVAGLALTLSACGGDPEPRFEEEPSPTPSEVTSSAPAKEAWEEKSDDGAIAFVEHWIDEFNLAVSTGDTQTLAELSASACVTCQNFIDLTDKIYRAGGRVESAGWSVRSLSEPKKSEGGTLISANFRQPEETIWPTSDSKPDTYSGGPIDYVLTLNWRDKRWQMASMDVLQ